MILADVIINTAKSIVNNGALNITNPIVSPIIIINKTIDKYIIIIKRLVGALELFIS
jgi:hypothetical protein